MMHALPRYCDATRFSSRWLVPLTMVDDPADLLPAMSGGLTVDGKLFLPGDRSRAKNGKLPVSSRSFFEHLVNVGYTVPAAEVIQNRIKKFKQLIN